MTLNKPFFTGISGETFDHSVVDTYTLLENAGLNTGNILFVTALRALLGCREDRFKKQ